MAEARHAFSFKLLHGPYSRPPCRVGEKLHCKIRGRKVVIGGMTKTPIPWPYTLEPTGRPSPILCGDLVRALRREAFAAIGHHWGASTSLVHRWRRLLGVTHTEGDARVKRYTVERFLHAAHGPEARAKSSTTRRRSNGTLDASLVRFGPFTKAEAALLGTDTDGALAKALGRSPEGVKQARQRRGIPSFGRKEKPKPSSVPVNADTSPRAQRGYVRVCGTWTAAPNVTFRHGPYAAPRCRVGDKLDCEYRGHELVVGGMTDNRIPWPYARIGGRLSPIVCGDLVRAVRHEAAIAVAYHWGVSFGLVTRWRSSLGVRLMENEGTKRLKDRTIQLASDEARRRAKEDAERRAKVTARRASKVLRGQKRPQS